MFGHRIAAPVLSHFSRVIFFKVSFLRLSSFLACVLSPFNQSASTLSSHHLLWLRDEHFQAGWHHNGRGGGPLKQMHIQNHFQHTRCFCITNSSVALRALALLSRGYFREHLSALKKSHVHKVSLVCIAHTQAASAPVGLVNCSCVRYSHPIEGIWRR